ncbi:NlpC/P60 family protein [Streptomyces sp. URMC 123]|uniref:C40 family peptidase n=1 Tax=Streptomyces sp. URMC 123 TaxID=3423403 RepID=UPI003F1ABE07
MASHRKPKQRLISGGTARTAATLAIAGAATATVLEGGSHAAPRPTPAQVRTEVDRLHHEAEEATEKYNGAKEAADKARRSLDALRDEAARRTGELNAARNAIGSMATAQYRSGGAVDPTMHLVLSSSPDQYLERASRVERAGSRQAAAVADIHRRLRGIEQLRERGAERMRELKERQAALAKHKAAINGKLAEAERLLDRLTAAQRAAVLARDGHGGGRAGGTGAAAASYARADRGAARGAPLTAPGTRAAQAISFAYGAIGKPYVWGATGPSAFDCSGLTQAAWRAAGVELPRTTYTQINAGQRVSRGELAPGDLVFFYSGISHVGLYIGNGQMIHAPRPGAAVRIAPVDSMPFAGATRPA